MQEKSIKVLFLALFLAGMFSIFVIAESQSCENYAKGEILVGFKENVTQGEAGSLIKSKNLSYSSVFSGRDSWEDPLLKVMKVDIPEGEEQTWITTFQGEEIVLYAELNCAMGVSNSGEINDSAEDQTNKSLGEKCFEIPERRTRIKCKLQNKEEIKSIIAEKYSEFANSSSIYETCQGLKTQGLCVAFMARSLKCEELEGEKKDRCFKVVSDFKDTKISSEILAEGNITKSKEKIANYMVLVLQNLEKRVEKANEEGRVTNENAATIIEKIVRIQKILLESKPTKSLLKSEIKELKTFWGRSIKDG